MGSLRRETARRISVDPLPPLEREPTEQELQEFLQADHQPVKADPAFRERLRAQLWRLLRSKASRR